MKRVWPTMVAFVAGCIHVHVPPANAPRGGAGLQPGDRVVTRLRNEFREATVITVDGALVTVGWDLPPPDRTQVARSWIVRLDEKPGKPRPGDWRLCPSDESWVP